MACVQGLSGRSEAHGSVALSPGLALDEPVGVKESEEGSKEERVGLAATPSTGWPHPR
jgi:hypothetical protein